MAHFKLDASIKFSRDQTVGHDHHHAWNGEQYKQQQNVPKRETRSLKIQPQWTKKTITRELRVLSCSLYISYE